MFVKKLKRALVAAVAGCMVLGSAFTSLAAGEAYKIKDLFVADTYLEEYVDLQEAIGDDDKALLEHYINNGVAEGRKSSLTDLIDLKKYREANPDLEAVYGDNWDGYLTHYLTYGVNEGRDSFGSGKFNATYYAEKYPDLMEAFGYDVFQLYRHYLQFGASEGRWSSRPTWEGLPQSSGSSSGSVAPVYEEVAVTGHLTDPETGEAIANAMVEAQLTSGTGLNRTAGTVSDNDNGTVSGGNADGYVGNGLYRVWADENGRYEFPSLIPGTYRITVTAEGYLGLTIASLDVAGTDAVETQPVTLLSTSSEGSNGVAGNVSSATTGQGIANVTIQFRNNWGSSGAVVDTVTTDAEGNYSIELPRGYYTATYSVDVYFTHVENVMSLSMESGIPQTAVLNPADMSEGEYRVVLTWGETPSDLDSHLYGQTETSDEMFHVYFADKQYIENGAVVAELDVDDVTSYGPETVTIIRDVAPGSVYRYSVHDFTNGGVSESYEMSNSGATVKVYKGTTLLRTYNVPGNTPGYIWNVFELNGDGIITSFNTINSEYSSMYVPVEE